VGDPQPLRMSVLLQTNILLLLQSMRTAWTHAPAEHR
jgi:hypothetical protein